MTMKTFGLLVLIAMIFHDSQGYLSDEKPLEVVGLWGQNFASKKIGAREPELEELCTESPYNVIVIGYVTRFFDTINEHGQYPGMDFSIHCDVGSDVNSVVSCPDISRAVEICHENQKKVYIGVGGPNALEEFTSFASQKEAELFAANIWNMFLGGVTQNVGLRPFGDVILDGVMIELRHGRSQFMNVFVQRLHEYRSAKPEVRDTHITFSTSCEFPDAYFGPMPGKPLQDLVAMDVLDEVFVSFTRASCCVIGTAGFQSAMQKWSAYAAKSETNLIMGIASSRYAVETPQCFNPADRVSNTLKSWQARNPLLTGVMIIDSSFDIANRRRYTYSNSIVRLYEQPVQQPVVLRPTPPLLPRPTPPLLTTALPPVEEEEEPVVVEEPIVDEEPIVEEPLTTLPPIIDEEDNLVIDSTTEGKVGALAPPVTTPFTTIVPIRTRPPATRAPPLNPALAAGGIPINTMPQMAPQWDFAQAAEIQRHRTSCKPQYDRVAGKWQLRCAQPVIMQSTRLKGRDAQKKKDKKKIRIKFKSPFKPNYIPSSKIKTKKEKKKKTKHSKRSKERKVKPKKKRPKITFKSPFKPSYIPDSLKNNKARKQ